MQDRQEAALSSGAVQIKVEGGEKKVRLPPNTHRVVRLGEESLEMMLQLGQKARMGEQDFNVMMQHLPLFHSVIGHLHAAEVSLCDPVALRLQIKNAFRAGEVELQEDLHQEVESYEGGKNEYDFENDDFIAPDEEVEEEHKQSRKRSRVQPDALDLAAAAHRYNKARKILEAHAPERLHKSEQPQRQKRRFMKHKDFVKSKTKKTVTVTETVTYGTTANPIEL
jgi:hypothetical protein